MTNYEVHPGEEKSPVDYEKLSTSEWYVLRGELLQKQGVLPSEPSEEHTEPEAGGYPSGDLFFGGE